jgi:transposase, IS5 family
MRKKFEQQFSVDIVPISEIKIPDYKRHELEPVLIGLQFIFTNQELNQQVFSILEDSILSGKKKTGRTGMDLWRILVLSVVRMTLDADYDQLWDIVNHHKLVRQIMGIESTNGFREQKIIPYTTVRDNASLLDEATIDKINTLVVKAGHQIVKKKEEKLKIKVDTYVMESNVHFPSDISLLWDAGHKCIKIIMASEKEFNLEGWRKSKLWYRKLKNQFRNLSTTCQSGGKEKEKNVKAKAKEYLRLARKLHDKVAESKETIYNCLTLTSELVRLMQLDYFHSMLTKHIDLVERRLIKGEIIPHEEKLFSIFEPHAEWIKKGKANNKVEIGHKILVSTDQYGFMLIHQVIEKQADVNLSIPLSDKLFSIYGEQSFYSMSFDKGFWKKEHKELLQLYLEKVIMPKKGNKNKIEQEEESTKEFKKLRNNHSGIESNINCLEHHGLNRCPDKGKKGFIKYAAIGVLAYNLHRFGMVLINQQEKRLQKEQLRKAA